MSIAHDTVTTATDEAPAPRRRHWPRVLAAFVLGLVLSLGVAVGGLLAWDASYEGRILSGVSVDGVDLSGMDRTEATAALTAAFRGYADGRVVVRTAAGEMAVPYEAFARRADVDAMVDAAARMGDPAARWSALLRRSAWR